MVRAGARKKGEGVPSDGVGGLMLNAGVWGEAASTIEAGEGEGKSGI